MAELSVVVPTFNEKGNISQLLEELPRYLPKESEIIVIDDGSPDGTAEVARRCGSSIPVRVYARSGSRSFGRSVCLGIRAAKGRYVLVMDADLQHTPETIRLLWRERTEGGIVLGVRYKGRKYVPGWSPFRLAISRVAIFLTHFVLSETRRTCDPMTGFFLFSGSLRSFRLRSKEKPLLSLLCGFPNAPVREVPYSFLLRKRGRSKFSVLSVFRFFCDLVSLSF